MSGKKQNPPFDPLPIGFDPSKNYHVSAWMEILPNFPFAGQMWAKAHWRIGMGKSPDGRYRTAIVRISDGQALQPDQYPPQSETAVKFRWTPGNLARWKNLARKHGNRAPGWQPPRKPNAAGHVWI